MSKAGRSNGNAPAEIPAAADRDFLRRLQEGEEKAHAAAFERYSDALFNYVMHRCGGRSSTAEDVVQEVFLRLFRDHHKLWKVDSDSRLFAWLCGIAGNVLAATLRGERRRSARVVVMELDKIVLSAVSQMDSKPLPEKLEDDETVRAVVNRTFSALPPRQQTLLRLKYLGNLSTKEIAARLNSNTHAVDTALWRARQVFKKVFQQVAEEAGYE